jgi:drug/metabolite transporter (DMT)-like permease
VRSSRATGGTLALIAVTAAWGSTFVLIKGLVVRLPVADFLAVRFVVAALALAVINPRAVRALTPVQRRAGLLLGLVYGLAQILQTTGLQHTSPAVSGFVTGMYVVFTPVFSAVLLRRSVEPITWIAVALATAGLALLALHGLSVGAGEALTLAAAALYAVHILGLGAWSTAQAAYGLSVLQMSAIAVVSLLFALPGGITLPSDGAAWVGVLYTAVVAGALALIAQTWAQAHLSATRAAVIMTMEPVFAAFFAVVFGTQQVTWRIALGGAAVLAAMYLVELGPRHAAEAKVSHVGPV